MNGMSGFMGRTSRVPDLPWNVLQFAERNAWRKIHDLVHSGTPLTEALSKLRHDHLFWQREVHLPGQLRPIPQLPSPSRRLGVQRVP